jgi:hypothetical protein
MLFFLKLAEGGKVNIIRMIKSRRVRWAGHMGEITNMYKMLVGKPEGKEPLGRPRHRWGITLKWIPGKWLEGVNWIHLAQERDCWRTLVNKVMNLQIP